MKSGASVARDDQLVRSSETPGPVTVGKVEQAPHGIGNLSINLNRGTAMA